MNIETSDRTPQIEEKAKALLHRNLETMAALRSYSAECWTTLSHFPSEKHPQGLTVFAMSTLTAIKPNLLRYNCWDMEKSADGTLKKQGEMPRIVFSCDGQENIQQFGQTYRISKHTKPDYLHTQLEPWNGFYAATESHYCFFSLYENHLKTLSVLRLEDKDMVEGVLCDVIAYQYRAEHGGDQQEYDGKLSIGPDNLTRRKRESIQFGKQPGYIRDAIVRNIRVDFPMLPASAFTYTPPEVTREDIVAEPPQ
jgi:hypothetical protein